MKIVFFGTSSLAASIVDFLLKEPSIEVVGVVTRPDKPQGRSSKLIPSPVKKIVQNRVPLFQPPKASTEEFANQLKNLDADLFVVAAYGEIIRQLILDIPPKGCINVHGSLLPQYRGAAPMQRALMNGEKETGITIIDMVLKMDAGAMLKKVIVDIPDEMNLGDLEKSFVAVGCPALLETIQEIALGTVQREMQDESLVTFADKITPEDLIINLNRDATVLHNQIRALSPKPGAYLWVEIGDEKKRLKILRTKVVPMQANPKEVCQFDKKNFIIGCQKDALQILELQPEGKKIMAIQEFLCGTKEPPKFL